jgi:Leucine-rich repeat (LRR) protein
MCILCRTKDITTLVGKRYLCACKEVYRIPDILVNLTQITCNGSKIITIPDTLINLESLFLWDCTELVSLPSTLIKLQQLVCSGSKLTSLPYFPELRVLHCKSCPYLTTLPSTLTTLLGLECCDNPQITEIPDTYLSLNRLNCSRTGVHKIPFFPDVYDLNCMDCPRLVSISTFPSLMICSGLCSRCPMLYHVGKSISLLRCKGTPFEKYVNYGHNDRYLFLTCLRIVKRTLYRNYIKKHVERLNSLPYQMKDMKGMMLRYLCPSASKLCITLETAFDDYEY